MADPLLLRRMEDILAGQARAEEAAAQQAARDGATEDLLRQVLTAVSGLAGAVGTLREAVDKIAEAANAETPKKEGKDLALALRAVVTQLGEQTVQIGRVAEGMDKLPAIMEATAINAAELATGGGAGPRPKL